MKLLYSERYGYLLWLKHL
ncbi:hypothetical protein [Pseudomonas sp. BE134]